MDKRKRMRQNGGRGVLRKEGGEEEKGVRGREGSRGRRRKSKRVRQGKIEIPSRRVRNIEKDEFIK